MKAQQDRHRRELAAIHIAKQQLGLDEETYREVLRNVAGVTSAANLDAAGRRKVLDHFRAHGWQSRSKGRPRPAGDRQSLIAKIRAQLAAADRPDAYADGMARHMFKVDRFEWCTPDQLRRIVAALTYDAKRHERAK